MPCASRRGTEGYARNPPAHRGPRPRRLRHPGAHLHRRRARAGPLRRHRHAGLRPLGAGAASRPAPPRPSVPTWRPPAPPCMTPVAATAPRPPPTTAPRWPRPSASPIWRPASWSPDMTPAEARHKAQYLRAHADALEGAAATAEAAGRDLQASDLDPMFDRLDAALADLDAAIAPTTGD